MQQDRYRLSNWATDDILNYIRQGRGNVCGRFRKSQLVNDDDPVVLASNIGQASIPLWSKIAAIILVVLGMQLTSCSSDEAHATGEPAMHHDSVTQVVLKDTVTADSLKTVQTTHKKRKHAQQETVPFEAGPEPIIMGIPADTVAEPPHDTVWRK